MLDFEEALVWIISAIFFGLLLSLKVVWPFLYLDPIQFLLFSAFCLVMLFIYICGQKIVAFFYDCKIKIKWLGFRQYWFRDQYRLKWSFPLWLILPILLFIISFSRIKWIGILNFDIEPKTSRIKRKFSNIDDIDVAKVAAAGPAISLIFGIFLRIIGLSNLAIYPFLLAFLSVFPFGNGFKILMGSRSLSVFMFITSGLMLLLVNLSGWFATAIIAILIGLFILVGYYTKYEQ